ncbi:MAG: SH3 domain-containing protein [Proteobacteria bacterium]|nr:SH3 domain-containing protein [Pseudomonadota bacterium]MDA1021999.1 SH3 domain-containing protein [Pseudomonadota bacterium]
MPVFRIFLGSGAIILLLAAFAPGLQAAGHKGTGLPLPRFVSLRAGEVNLRTGPGVQHPIDWVYHRQNLPLEIIAEYGTWRKTRDWQGTQGWVHQSMVGAKRTFIVTGDTRTVRRKSEANSEPMARAEAGVIGKLISCPNLQGWCRVEIGGREGWLRRVEIWGLHRGEVME